MISLQAHNQVLYHLTQFTSARSSAPLSVNRKRHNLNHKESNVFCEESFSQALKSFQELYSLISPLRLTNKEIWEMLKQISTGKMIEIPKKSSKWKVSYISGQTFDDNKRGYPFTSLTESAILPTKTNIFFKPRQRFCQNNLAGIQIRCFKTDRNIKAEFDRNPTLRTRVRRWFGLNENIENKLGNDNILSSSGQSEHADVQKLKKILDDKYVKVDELQKIKAAFAEGYLAGHDQKPRGRTIKALRFVQQMVSTFLVIVLLGVLMATTGGSMFKIQIGSRVEVDPEEIHVTFNDVKGVDEAKTELMDVVEFLRNPEKFSVLGGKLPKGVLLVGPPGTGKTLLARAVAGEAGVPFFHAAGPEFDEILVGQGARRVRDLFKAAKERAPCVIFIDEIDSVGAKRTNSALHPYANQTINQLLSEMDGFHQNEGVIVLGATNRQGDLDKALLRPGRFDLEVHVNAPDYLGRKEILDLYLSRILTQNVNSEFLAKCTTGFTGADIENMVNQAALRAAIEGAEYVTMQHLERARDKVLMGPEGKKKAMDEEENNITAYHEGGHALVSYYTKDATPLHKVTIIPRGQSLGHTSYLPHKDMHYMTKAQMLATMDACMGGRAGEELIFGLDKVTSGASNDFQNATMIAEDMVKRYGMSEKVGFRVHRDPQQFENASAYSPSTKELIDSEVKRLLQESYERAKAILKTHHKEHKQLAEALLKYETLDAEEVKTIISGKKLRKELAATKSDITRTVVDVQKNIM